MKPFNPDKYIQHHKLNLPHWRQDGCTYFVTFRLADALPREKLVWLRDEKRTWLRAHGLIEPSQVRTLPESAQREYHRRITTQVERWLDAGYGSCRLRDSDAQGLVVESLDHFDGERYRLETWVVMPNHVHALVTPLGAHTLGGVVGSWKKYTAREINKRDGREGSFWQAEGDDHIVRDAEAHARFVRYIADNPKKAHLRGGSALPSHGGAALPSQAKEGLCSGEQSHLTRRAFLSLLAAAAAPALAAPDFRLRYLLSSAMYGTGKLEDIVPEVKKTGATHIDLWPRKHGDQREQMDAMGHDAFAALLDKHGVKLGCLTRYDLGPFKLAAEMKVAQRFGCRTIMTAAHGPKGMKADDLKNAVKTFAEEMKPHCAEAEKHGVTIAIENHGNGLMESMDSIRWLVEFAPSPALGIALAPYHLPQDEPALAALVRECGKRLTVFIAWQHGKGCMTAMPKEDELQQMPGRGPLNFAPLLAALREINFQGFTNVFMHPTPRGIPIVEGGTSAVTDEINRARAYLDATLAKA